MRTIHCRPLYRKVGRVYAYPLFYHHHLFLLFYLGYVMYLVKLTRFLSCCTVYLTWAHHRLTALLYCYMRACKCHLFTYEGSRRLPKRLNNCFSILAIATNRSIRVYLATKVYIVLNDVLGDRPSTKPSNIIDTTHSTPSFMSSSAPDSSSQDGNVTVVNMRALTFLRAHSPNHTHASPLTLA